MIRHPNVVDVLDVGESPDGNPFMVMELVDGEDLQMLLERRGSLSWDEAKLYLRQVCDGLAAAHDAGVVHRDLKLSNCIVVEHNGRPTVKVVDFGLAKPTGEALKRLTAMGTVIGTPEYMSPEQCSGQGEVDHRTDVYAVGVMAYELLTGAPPYTDSNFMRLLLKHIEQPVPSPSGRNPKLSRGVDALLLRALAKNKEDRIPTMREFAEEIEMAHTTAYAKIHYRKAIAGAVVKLRCSSSDATDLDAVVTNPRVEPITNARTQVSGVGLVEASMSGVRTLISKVGALTEPNRVVTRRHGERSSSGVSASEPVTLRSEVLEADDVRTMVHVEQRDRKSVV
jgi:serine/threonine protein kinase